MNVSEIEKILIRKGFSEKESSLIAENLAQMDISLLPLLEKWLIKDMEEDYKIGDLSINLLKSKFNLEYQAALLTMDWIIKEPEIAIEAIKKGIK